MTTRPLSRLPVTPAPAGVRRLLAGWQRTGAPAGLTEHLHRYGPLPGIGSARLIAELADAGLRGRGGAGFPTDLKLAEVVAGERRPVVVANGCEGEPASEKDTALLGLAPHLVLDGALLAARASDAVEVLVCVHEGSSRDSTLSQAVTDRRRDGILIRIVEVPARYVASQETALVHFLDRGDARPTSGPSRPSQRGVHGRPTLVDNVETLAHLSLIARYGGAWFRSVGAPDMPGTALVTVGGAVVRPGVYEVATGNTLGAVLQQAGGPLVPIQAVLLGGYAGSWLPVPDQLDSALSPAGLQAAGARLGAGVVLALPARACGLAQTAHLLSYLAGESAAQCGPCTNGLPAIAADLAAIVAGYGEGHAAVRRLRRRLPVIAGRGACAHPDGAVRLAASALTTFAADLAEHLGGRPCAGAGEPPRFPIPTTTRR